MAKIDMKKWSYSIINGYKLNVLPLMTHPGIELIGKNVREACSDGNIQFEAIKSFADNYNSAAYTSIMDLTVEAEALGALIISPENEVPSVTGRLLKCEEDIVNLTIPENFSVRMNEYIKAVSLSATYFVDKPFFAGCIGPFSLAGRLYDLSEMMMLLYINPDSANILLNKCTAFIKQYCKVTKQSGANGIIMAEPAAGLLSNDDCIRYSSIFIKKIIEEIQDDNFLVILHNCGNTGHCTKAMVATGANAYHFGNKADMVQVIKDVPSNKLVMGNIDPVSIIKMGNRNDICQAVMNLVEKMKGHNNFIISTGCDTPPNVPPKNIDAFFETVENINRQISNG